MSRSEAVRLNDEAGRVAQEILQIKLWVHPGNSGACAVAQAALQRYPLDLPIAKFWQLLHMHVVLASYVLVADPSLIYNPLGRDLPVQPPMRIDVVA